jgi:hypothetical protein
MANDTFIPLEKGDDTFIPLNNSGPVDASGRPLSLSGPINGPSDNGVPVPRDLMTQSQLYGHDAHPAPNSIKLKPLTGPSEVQDTGVLGNMYNEAKEGLKGAGKWVVHQAQTAPNSFGSGGLSWNGGDPTNWATGVDTGADNSDQQAGKYVSTAASLIPLALGIKSALPSAERAKVSLNQIEAAGANTPVPLTATAAPLQEARVLDQTGSNFPKSVTQLMTREQAVAPPNFPEARKFYSNISSASADEKGAMNGPTKYAVGNLREGLNQDLTAAANTIPNMAPQGPNSWSYGSLKPLLSFKLPTAVDNPTGLGSDYESAMSEFRHAKQLSSILGRVGAIGATGYGLDAGAHYAFHKLKSLLGH